MAGSKRRPYLGLKRSMREFFTDAVRYIKEGNKQESLFEKPYRDQDYRKMHLDWSLPDWPRISSGVDIPSGPFGDLSKQHAIVWGPGNCWLNPANCECGEAFTLTGRMVNLPPATEGLGFAWNVWTDEPDKVEITEITLLEGGVTVEVSGFVHDEDFSGVVTVCALAALVSGKLVQTTFWEGRPGAFSNWSGLTLEEEIARTTYYENVGYDCGCTQVSVECGPDCTLCTTAWDDDNSADTVARNNDCTVAITDSGNCGPYSWSVEGTGFSLDNASTSGLTNTLNADGTGCGIATVTVTDACGNEITGEVKCTSGSWTVNCSLSGQNDGLNTGHTCHNDYYSEKKHYSYNDLQTIRIVFQGDKWGGIDAGHGWEYFTATCPNGTHTAPMDGSIVSCFDSSSPGPRYSTQTGPDGESWTC